MKTVGIIDYTQITPSKNSKNGVDVKMSKIVSEYNQEIQHLQNIDKPMSPRGRATKQSPDTCQHSKKYD